MKEVQELMVMGSATQSVGFIMKIASLVDWAVVKDRKPRRAPAADKNDTR